MMKQLKLTDLGTGKVVLSTPRLDATVALNTGELIQGTVPGVSNDQAPTHDHVHDQVRDNGLSLASTTAQTVVNAVQRSWSEIAGADRSQTFADNIPMLEHTPQVRPIFVNYKKVSATGFKAPLIDVAIAIAKVVSDKNVDAVQLTRNGWQIYVKTEADRAVLMTSGMDLVGKHISVASLGDHVHSPNVKITIKDLPLHEVSNEEVLAVLKTITNIASPVKYSNIWLDSHQTHLRNGDRFVYIPEASVKDLPSNLFIREFKARVHKPVAYARCSRCQETGHHVSSNDCPALAPPEVHDSTEAFREPTV